MKIKACPFCGSTDCDMCETESGLAGLHGHYFVECYGCYAQSGTFDTKREAKVAWNRRALCARKQTPKGVK